MEHSLFTKTEIELLLKRAQSGKPPVEPSESAQKVAPFDFRAVGQLSSGQIEKLLALHADFAGQLARSWSSLLAIECQVTPAGVEQISFGDFVTQSADGLAFGILRTQALEGQVFVQADLPTVLSIIDLMLGGVGSAMETTRSLTAIEQEIFKPVMSQFGAELQAVWAPLLETNVHLEHYGAVENLPVANERVLQVKFEVHFGEMNAMWSLILPSMVSNALTRNMEQQASPAEEDRSGQNQRVLQERLLNGRFRLELFLPPSKVSMRKLAHLKAGQVVVLKSRSTDPIHFNLEGIKLFQASPVSCGTHRGAQIRRALSITKGKEKEAR